MGKERAVKIVLLLYIYIYTYTHRLYHAATSSRNSRDGYGTRRREEG